ncbi:S-methyl-5-thioribose-1-phosphate isomerase [candidate division KSB1 bacterium]|nr:S-methyl-5-thioribose-1-phosphate isomerase [candidate division KSB1 bacterium]MBL7094028.1 S-methyl-5-thioribose-1-phosphate isomerase [candidate division KSB1 bacterium]
MNFKTIEWKNNKVILIDQTRIPIEEKYLEISDYRELADAIIKLKVRGAPAIGIAGALGVCLGANKIDKDDKEEFNKRLKIIIDELAATRPTAVNLFWALERMSTRLENSKSKGVSEIKEQLLREALAILDEDKIICKKMGENGASLLKDGDTVLTHCNSGALVAGGIGTAVGAIHTAFNQGKKIKVFADETRPLLQGARLTTWELLKAGIDVTLICDNVAAYVMQQGLVNCVMLGADRIAANGDVANKIGTYGLAVLAKYHNIPFYVVAPTTTFDMSIKTGSEIPIEQRASEEVTFGFGKQTAPDDVPVYNPAFDVTPNELITAIISEQGIYYPPFDFKDHAQ